MLMDQISAADNHTIHFAPNRWRISYSDKPLAEASERGFRYGNRFGSTRRLPHDGMLSVDLLQQVVLGWEPGDESWHLGLVLIPSLAQERGSRWIELVSWPDHDRSLFEELGVQAGQALASVLGIPFYYAQPQIVESAPAEPPLPSLPLHSDVWTLNAAEDGSGRLVLRRSHIWTQRVLWQAFWHFFWMVIYIAVSGATLHADIALPNTGTFFDPHYLPYMGLLIALLLLALGIRQILILLREPNIIEIDGAERVVRALRKDKPVWVVSALDAQSVYVSELIRRKKSGSATEYGEINLHLGSGTFSPVITQHEPSTNAGFPAPLHPFPQTDPEIEALTADRLATPLQAMGLYIARKLSIDAWYDLRLY
jgi:hypothetical protein